MDIKELRENVARTIRVKEVLLKKCEASRSTFCFDSTARTIDITRTEYLKLNLHELRLILNDIDTCIKNDKSSI